MKPYTLIVLAVVLITGMLCGTVLTAMKIMPPDMIVHTISFVVGGVIGIISPGSLTFPESSPGPVGGKPEVKP